MQERTLDDSVRRGVAGEAFQIQECGFIIDEGIMEVAEAFVVFREIWEDFEEIFSGEEEKFGEAYASVSFRGLDAANEADDAETASLIHFAYNWNLGIFID